MVMRVIKTIGTRQRQALGLALGIFALDQLSKPFIMDLFEDGRWRIPVTSFLDIVLVGNRGVSFGLFANDSPYGPYVLAGLAVLISGAVGWFLLRPAQDRLVALACGLVIGGALGNALDRLLYGAVVDFISISIPFIPLTLFNPWPAFNVADSAIVIGALYLAYDGFRPHRDGTKPGS